MSAPSRRTFLKSAPAAAAVGVPVSVSGATATSFKLGVASYSFREFRRTLCIKYTKELNTPYLCIKEFHAPYCSTPEELDRAREEFKKGGIILTGGGTIYFLKDDDADIRFYFEYAKRLGLPMIIAGPTAQTLPKLEKYVQQYDIKVAVHNHGPEDKHFPAPSDVLKLIRNMDPRIGLCIDVGHTTRTGKNLLSEIQAAGPRLLDMHIKDLTDLMDKDGQVDVGLGVMPIPAIFKQLQSMNYTGMVNLEYEIHGDDPLPGMQRSFSYMRGVLAGLQG